MPLRNLLIIYEQNLGTSSTEQLQQLAQFLAKQLRAKKITTLYLPSAHRDSLESQWGRYDEMGVPYQVLLNERTLKNGIVQLRSRDTTLKVRVELWSVFFNNCFGFRNKSTFQNCKVTL